MHIQLEDGAKREVTGGLQAAWGFRWSVTGGASAFLEKSVAQASVNAL